MPPPPPVPPAPLLALLVMPAGAARRAAAAALEGLGLAVRTASEPYAAALAFAERPADLLVLDLAGFRRRDEAFVAAIRRRSPLTRVLLLLPEGRRRAALRALERGADAYVLDPFHAEELGAVARGLLRERLDGSVAGPEALRRLSAEVAHAINNPLQVLSLSVEAGTDARSIGAGGARGAPASHPAQEPVARIRDVVAILNAYSRLAPPEPEPLDFGRALRTALDSAASVGQVTLLGAAPVDGPVLSADPGQWGEALASVLACLAGRASRLPLEVRARVRTKAGTRGWARAEVLGRGIQLTQEELIALPASVLTSNEHTRRPLPGLAFAAAVVRQGGGSLRVRQVGSGAVVALRLPLG